MESNDQNENVILIDGENEICFNQWNMQIWKEDKWWYFECKFLIR